MKVKVIVLLSMNNFSAAARRIMARLIVRDASQTMRWTMRANVFRASALSVKWKL